MPDTSSASASASASASDAKVDQNYEIFDWSSVFPAGRIKSQIQEQDDNLGCLPKKTLQLISACSALLLKQIIQQACLVKQQQHKQHDKHKNTGATSSSSVMILSARDLQQGILNNININKNNSLECLQDVAQYAVQQDDYKIAHKKRAAKKRKYASNDDTVTVTSNSKKQRPSTITTDLRINQDSFAQAVEIISKQQDANAAIATIQESSRSHDNEVILDEEDYD